MKILTLALLFTFICSNGFTQTARNRQEIDSLKHQIAIAKHDTNRVLLLVDLVNAYRFLTPDSALVYAEKALYLAKKSNFPKGEALMLNRLAGLYRVQGDIPKSLEYRYKALKIIKEKIPSMDQSTILNGIGLIYMDINDYPKALSYFQESLKVIRDSTFHRTILYNMAQTFMKSNQLDSSQYYLQKVAKEAYVINNKQPDLYSSILRSMGEIQFLLGKTKTAFDYLHQALKYLSGKDHRLSSDAYVVMSKLYTSSEQRDSSIYYANKGLIEAASIGYQKGILDACDLLVALYELEDKSKALYYHKMARAANNELYGVKRVQGLQKIVVDELERQQKAETEKIVYQNQLKQYAFLAGLGIFVFIVTILYRNNRQKRKANLLLNKQKEKVEETLKTLKSTQAQLIQKEKLASLGELTAGIAHEIQNPLNFVNNFSEMSVDLAKELKEEVKKSEIDKELIIDLATDLSQNQQKINHHGKRASSIVSGMLEHSRTSTGERALTDINKLADEYLRLSYHGMRAKDSNFNSNYQTNFDENLPKIEVIPQDMGRVLLNLINNAFWAVKTVEKPLVTVITEQTDNQIIIKVSDNGTGMNEEVKAKIFQPFFTTKPTGQGTGLGLSLAYDIVTKGHGGTIEVESVEGEGATFVVKLPL